MKLSQVINAIPISDRVTITNYETDDILIDNKTVVDVMGAAEWHKELKCRYVCRLEVGKVHGDLIISTIK